MTSRRRRGLRDKWLPYVFAIGEQDCQVGSLLHAMYLRMSDAGYVQPWSRENYAKLLRCSPDAVSWRIGQAINKWQVLAKRGGGYSGRLAEYEALLPVGKVEVITTTILTDQDHSRLNLSSGVCPSCGKERLRQLTQPIARASTDGTTNVVPLRDRGGER